MTPHGWTHKIKLRSITRKTPYQSQEPDTQGPQVDSLLTLTSKKLQFRKLGSSNYSHTQRILWFNQRPVNRNRTPRTRCPSYPEETTKHLKSGYTPGIRIQTRHTEPPMTPLFSTTKQQHRPFKLFAGGVCCLFWKKKTKGAVGRTQTQITQPPLPSGNN